MNRIPAASLFLVAALAVPMGAAAKSSDRNQPLGVDADSSDCSTDERAPCLFTGNVEITQGTLEIKAARVDVRRSNGEIQRTLLTGSPVRMKQQMDDGGWVDATAAQADYTLTSDTVVLTGNAVVNQPGQGKIEGQRIVYNMGTGRVQGGGEGQGRVRMQFQPRNQTPAQPAPAAQGGR